MIVSLIILGALVAVGFLLWLHERFSVKKNPPAGESADLTVQPAQNDACCGMHITCEKDSLSTAASTEIIYYDDEELDIYAGRAPESYTSAETEQFRDILLTLLPSDIAGWARSLQLRDIVLPPEIRDELLLIVAEARAATSTA